MEGYIRNRPFAETPDAARARFSSETDTVLREDVPWPLARRLWRARILRASQRFLSAEEARAVRGVPS